MPATPRATALKDLLRGPVEAQKAFLEDVTVTAAGRRSVVRVVVDLPAEADGELELDQVATLSRTVSETLDGPEGDAVLGQSPYVLEVSTPGVDRPLTEPRHWYRARRRIVEVTPTGAAPLRGRVETVGEHGVVIDGALLAWASLEGARGRVQVEMSRPEADEASEGASDEIDESTDDQIDDSTDTDIDTDTEDQD